MLNDVAALTPPLLVCAAFAIAVIAFIRHEMSQPHRPVDEPADAADDDANPDAVGANQRVPVAEQEPGDAHAGSAPDVDGGSRG
jgi:hypothetical protein